MNKTPVSTFKEFRELIESLLANRDAAAKEAVGISNLLFRGQSDATWKLETSLERVAGSDLLLRTYHLRISSIQKELESLLGRAWTVPSYPDYDKILKGDPDFYPLPDELYEYLTFLRHHGFPSPLLDWSRSPYVASYFAFREAKPDIPVALFVFQEYAGKGKTGMAEAPRIEGIGPHVRTHPRHFFQQCEYTVALEHGGRDTIYCPYERALPNDSSQRQDLLVKIELPGSLRKEALQYLELHNINASSLFRSDEATVESLAIKEFVLKV